MQHISFPSIEQYRNVITHVTRRSKYAGINEAGEPIFNNNPLPTLSFVGTVKLHGTNAAIITDKSFEYFQCQSRENIITPIKDNAGFAAYITTYKDIILSELKSKLQESIVTIDSNKHVDDPDDDTVSNDKILFKKDKVCVFGEWCGSNIQKGVALSNLPKMFVIFAVKYNNVWVPKDVLSTISLPDIRVYNIYQFPTFQIDIDFTYPQAAQNKLIELTSAVEKECPVGKFFDVNGIGEGIVWACTTEGWRSSRMWFKVKGEAHQSSKVKTLAPVNIEKVNNVREFVEMVCTESRLSQGLDKIRENNPDLDKKHVADFLRWIFGDVVKEELDTLTGNGLEPKDISSALSSKAREWYFNQIFV